MTRLGSALGWLRRHPLAVLLPAQAVLLFTDLGRMPVWGDEHGTLQDASVPIAALGAQMHNNVHPALYYALLHGWMSALCGGPCIIGARALSAVLLLATTVVVDRCWLRGLDPRSRTWFLLLWTLSPALLLYGRMARYYSLLILLACLALYTGSRYARRATLPSLLAYVVAATALLYTHYLPGVAVVAGVSTAMAWRAAARRRLAALWPLALSLLCIGLAFAPWLPHFSSSVELVAGRSAYHLVGPLVDTALALAFAFVSFSIGESIPAWALVAFLLLSPALVLVLVRGLREPPLWLGVVAPAALVGFVGGNHWVSYAFVAPRLLFLLPFYLLLVVRGARVQPRLGTVVCAGVAVLSLAGVVAYFEQTGFLNKAYLVPTETIADTIRAGSPDAAVTVILDHYSIDLSAVAGELPHQTRIVFVADAASAAQAAGLARTDGPALVWFAHNAHDISPEGWNQRIEDAFAERFSLRRRQFVPYTTLDRWLMRLAGWAEPPRYAVELLEMRATQ